MTTLSSHAERRCQNRGVRHNLVAAILQHADVDTVIGDDCRLLRVHRRTANALALDDRLARYAVIWSDTNARIVTVLPVHQGRRGRRYRKTH